MRTQDILMSERIGVSGLVDLDMYPGYNYSRKSSKGLKMYFKKPLITAVFMVILSLLIAFVGIPLGVYTEEVFWPMITIATLMTVMVIMIVKFNLDTRKNEKEAQAAEEEAVSD